MASRPCPRCGVVFDPPDTFPGDGLCGVCASWEEWLREGDATASFRGNVPPGKWSAVDFGKITGGTDA